MSFYFFIVFLLAVAQRNAERSRTAIAFLAVTFCFDTMSQRVEEDFYYLVCAFGSWFTIIVLRSLSNISLSVCLQMLCFVSVALNFLGYMLWINYYPVTMYNQLFIIVCVCAIYALLRGIWGDDDGRRAGSSYNINASGAGYSLRVSSRKLAVKGAL